MATPDLIYVVLIAVGLLLDHSVLWPAFLRRSRAEPGPALGLWGAAALSVVVFGAAHAYQGAGGTLKTGIVGGLLTLVVLLFGSLLPAIALHALLDIGQGVVCWLVLREAPGGESGGSGPSPIGL